MFANKQKVAKERQHKLTQFLMNLIKDRDLQNLPLVHEFLSLPPNFKFTPDFFKPGNDSTNSDDKFLIIENPENISRMQWLTYLKNVRSVVETLSESTVLAAKLANREKASKYIRPNVDKLAASLQHLAQTGEISSQELKQRASMLSSLQARMEAVATEHTPSSTSSTPEKKVKMSKRVFYQASDLPVETPETVGLSNRELIQHQQQIHLDQDKDLEELRKIIARQREIGETINREVEEQSELLDSFSNQVDVSGDKLRSARGRVKKIT
ncbi:hypothetical protein JCM33374_g496 [Metschnikowia sp. JCM 33374]|nr:hypothetical protein JCM33374_g496 [Metschnikowia sp. JCM 33374]